MKILSLLFVAIILLLIVVLFLSRILYALAITLYLTAIKLASTFNAKAKLWVEGRKNIFENLSANFNYPDSKKIWVHCASLGEFEQGRPIIESIRSKYPEAKILLTFFSPSGYEVRKNYDQVDYVTYLPIDTLDNAKKFIDSAKPDLALFIKYEYWVNYIEELHKRQIPTFLISAIFKKSQLFFKWYGGPFKTLLKKYTGIFVQDSNSLKLLEKKKLTNGSLSGDTRFDRVLQVAEMAKDIPQLKNFIHEHNILVAGSTWPADEKILKTTYKKYFYDHRFKLIVAPHQIDEKSLKKTKKVFNGEALLFSEIENKTASEIFEKDILIIDNIGMLSSLYRYSDLSYIGGGFNKGIHNILEAAVYGKPIFIGPKIEKFKEATDLVEDTAAFKIYDSAGIVTAIVFMQNFKEIYENASRIAKLYVEEHGGATEKVLNTLDVYLTAAVQQKN